MVDVAHMVSEGKIIGFLPVSQHLLTIFADCSSGNYVKIYELHLIYIKGSVVVMTVVCLG